jgi:hypothetical protein
MKKFLVLLSAMSLILSIATVTNAVPTNVALNGTVTLNGGSFFTGGWGSGLTVSANTIVDGVFLSRGIQWDQGPVWWDSHEGASRWIEIDLGGTFSIETFVVQADDNDAYILSYWDLGTANWELAWDVPNYDALGWGMQTRPNPADDTERYLLSASIVTNALRFEGDMGDTDLYFAVSEIQAYGESVPEPATMLLLGSGLLGLAGLRRKFKRR